MFFTLDPSNSVIKRLWCTVSCSPITLYVLSFLDHSHHILQLLCNKAYPLMSDMPCMQLEENH